MTERCLETIDTPSLLIGGDRPVLVRRQEELDARGIIVAKLGEVRRWTRLLSMPEGAEIDRIGITPIRAFPTTNPYDVMNLVPDSRIADEWPVLCRGKPR